MDELDSRAVNDRTDLVCDPAGSVPDPGLILAKTSKPKRGNGSLRPGAVRASPVCDLGPFLRSQGKRVKSVAD